MSNQSPFVQEPPFIESEISRFGEHRTDEGPHDLLERQCDPYSSCYPDKLIELRTDNRIILGATNARLKTFPEREVV